MNLVGILCQDHVYNKRLSEYLMSRGNAKFCVNSFSTKDSFMSYIENNRLDILIVEDKIYHVLKESKKKEEIADHYLILTDEIMEPALIDKDSFSICRYISSASILEYLNEILGDSFLKPGKVMDQSFVNEYGKKSNLLNSKNVLGTEGNGFHKNCTIIGIFSEVHDCGKTSLAFLMSQFLQEKGRTLYLPMDYRNPVFSSKERCLINVIYTVFRQTDVKNCKELQEHNITDESFTLLMKENVRTFESVEYIPCSSYKADMSGIEACYIRKIMEYMTMLPLYDYLIVDFCEGVDFKECLQLCDQIIMPIKEDCLSDFYVETFKEEWKTFVSQSESVDNTKGDVFERFRFIRLPKPFKASSPVNYYKELAWSPIAGTAKNIVDEITA